MDLIVSGKNIKLTPSLKNYVSEKVGKLAGFWGKIIRARVELNVEKSAKEGKASEVNVNLEVPGKDITAQVKASEMHEAIDLVVPKLESQIRKAKGKMEDKIRRLTRRDK